MCLSLLCSSLITLLSLFACSPCVCTGLKCLSPRCHPQVAWFTETYWPDLLRHIFRAFPFSRLVGRRKKSSAAGSSSGSSAGSSPPAELGSDAINALVCELVAGLAAGEVTAQARRSVLEYLTGEQEGNEEKKWVGSWWGGAEGPVQTVVE